MNNTMFRSTKGASKQRRDLINGEITVLRDLLPLPEAARQRLSQLQIMSLACVYIRKCNFFSRLFGDQETAANIGCEFSQTMTGFLLVASRDGKLLYISDNVTEYLGHSMVDMMTQGDSIYDIIDKRDHPLVQTQLMQTSYAQCASPGNGVSAPTKRDERTFFCRMNVARSFRRQAGFGDHKMMHVSGHFVTPMIRDHYGNQPVFMAMCTPLITPDVKETAVQNSTLTYYSVHGLDMKYSELGHIGQHHLGYNESEMCNKSWYELLHPEDILEAKDKHVQLIKSSHEMGCMLTVRLQHKLGHWVWTNIVMHIRQPFVCDNGEPAIVCINQVIEESEAQHFKIQSQLYSSHIARSPEFLGPQDTSPQHTITQVPVESTSYAGQSYLAGLGQCPQSGGEESMYQVDFLAATTQAMNPGTVQAQPSSDRGTLIHQRSSTSAYTDSGSEYSSGSPTDTKQAVRDNVINRLKRKMSEINAGSNCKPNKISRVSAMGGHGGSSPSAGSSYQATAVIANMSLFGRSGGDFPMGGDVQVLAPAHEGPVYQQLNMNLKKNIVLSQNDDMMQLAQAFAKPPTPLTPDSMTSENTTEFTPDLLTIDVSDSAMIPASILTPDASPVSYTAEEVSASPQPHTDPSFEYNTNLPALEDLSFFEESVEKMPVKSKVLHLPQSNTQHLPVIDALSLEQMLSDLNPSTKVEVKSEPCEPLPPAPTTQVQAPAMECSRMMENEDLLNQVTNVLMDMLQNAADGNNLDLTQFITPQDGINEHMSPCVQAVKIEDTLGRFDELAQDPINDELCLSLDEFQRLTTQMDIPHSPFGECDLPSSLLTQNL